MKKKIIIYITLSIGLLLSILLIFFSFSKNDILNKVLSIVLTIDISATFTINIFVNKQEINHADNVNNAYVKKSNIEHADNINFYQEQSLTTIDISNINIIHEFSKWFYNEYKRKKDKHFTLDFIESYEEKICTPSMFISNKKLNSLLEKIKEAITDVVNKKHTKGYSEAIVYIGLDLAKSDGYFEAVDKLYECLNAFFEEYKSIPPQV